MTSYWEIKPNGIHGHGPQSQLISCTISQLEDEDGVHYALFGPNGTWRALQHATKFPIRFPQFKAKLNGDHERDWYIEITGIIPGAGMQGTWGNYHYVDPPPRDSDADSDTWTAQATSGVKGVDDDAVAAAASSKQ